jgi:outer membrane receptor protein involved in Fe transport
LLFATGALVQAIGVAAQDSPAVLEVIVVTATKREASLGDVPVSVVALDGQRLLETNIQSMSALGSYVPNMTMAETGIGNHIAVRGIFSGENPGFEQSVGTYVDGIYRGRGQQARALFFDLERVEVLRGSQSTLFGKNSIAGALNITTARPTESADMYLQATYEPETSEREVIGAVSGPISSSLRGRLAARYRSQDGHIDNLTLDRDEPQREESSLRASLEWDAPNNFDVRFKAEVGRFDVRGREIEILQEQPAATGPFTGLEYSQILQAFGQDPSVANTTQDFARSANGDFSNNDSLELVLSVNKPIGRLELTSITGYSEYQFDELCDCDFTGGNVFKAGFNEEFDQVSQEFRLTSPAEDRVAFIAGLYFETRNLRFFDTLFVDDGSVIVPVVNALTMSESGQFIANTGTPRYFSQDTTNWSVFGEATWTLSERLRLTAGLRLATEEKSASRSLAITDINGGPLEGPAAVVAPALYAGLFNVTEHDIRGDRTEEQFLPSLSVQYDFRDSAMGYVLISRGAKAGGFDERSNNAPANGGSFEFGDESATNFEAGVKMRLGQGAAEINAALYRTEFRDMQVSVFDGVLGYNVRNAGEAVTQGLELDARWAVSERLLLSAAIGTTDFEFRDYIGQCYFGQVPDAPDGVNCNYRGQSNVYAPDWNGIVSARFSQPLGAALLFRAVADLTFTDDYFTTPTLDPQQVQEAFARLNLRLSIGDGGGRWEVAVIGKNLTDRAVVPYSLDTPLAGASFGAPSFWGFVDEPRTIGLQASVAF